MKGKFVIYQMLPRVFGNTHAVNRPGGTLAENGTGKFKDITVSVLEEIRKLNVSYIWYTGIVRHAVAGDPGVKGGAGSPFGPGRATVCRSLKLWWPVHAMLEWEPSSISFPIMCPRLITAR